MTAYEMRISDWSSDVCSSDLGIIDTLRENEASARAYALHFMPLVAILGFDLFPFRLDRSLSANGIGGRNDALIVAIILHQLEWIIQIIGPAVANIANELQRDVLLHARHLFQLGRASCRERVCQYV